MDKKYVALSLFNGMGCMFQALERIGIKMELKISSEIDKYAILVNDANYPDTIQVGSVCDINIVRTDDGINLVYPKGEVFIPNTSEIIFAGGSPCQSFSFAGKRKGMATKCEQEILTLEHYLQLKNDGFEFEGQSYLFWEYMRVLKEVKPTYFLLENVIMGEKWERILSKAIGVNPIEINSSLVSAQNRRRLYWTNIGLVPGGLFGDLESTITQPKDKGILLKDILESEVDEKYYLSEKIVNYITKRVGVYTQINGDKSLTLCKNSQSSQTGTYIKIDKKGNIKDNQDKASCFTAGGNSGGNHSDMDLIVYNTMPRSSKTGKGGTGPLSRNDGKAYCLDTGNTNTIELKAIMLGRSEQFGNPEKEGAKSVTLCANEPHGIKYNSRIRRLTPTECERLQTVKDGYTNHVSDTQRYRMLGNGWTVSVIEHIFSFIKK